ncbi:hypothetical protein [Chryseobacterium fistulae]|uniref:Uncharacterized protein n=1 Tax=Chryseobacterium fistulae TaxID=2675058 RepID=A0A6N4XUI4_9FLAO|nr:hypothetical protein [Chryseobacterium fistulae]CAA7386950.1 hypothetical protein CHRY9393_01251 [Chryseobacterium fistulae]
MKKLLFISYTLLSVSSFGQNIAQLDEKNGFKDFKLGDPLSKWSSQVRHVGRISDNTEAYDYVGICCNMLFNYSLENIKLIFNNSKLIGIMLKTTYFQKPYNISNEFTKWRSQDFESINNSFTQLFGEPTSIKAEETTFHWTGNKVVLISIYNYLGVRGGDNQIVMIINADYVKNMKKSGF